MRHRVAHKKLGRDTNQRKALLRGLATSLILHERIKTTEAKAKAIRPVVEKLVTRARENTIANRRLLLSKLGGSENVVSKLLEVVGPHFKERAGGYTRIIKISPRKGDNAQMALIEFVDKVSEIAVKKKLEKKEVKAESKTKEKIEKKPKSKAVAKKPTKPADKKAKTIKEVAGK